MTVELNLDLQELFKKSLIFDYHIYKDMEDTWIDVTQELFSLTQKMSFLDVVWHSSIDLEDTMHAHEINDPKIDPKWDIRQQYTIDNMMARGQVKLPDTLSIKDLKNIFSHILKQQALIMQGHTLQQTIYTFNYLYSPKLSENCLIISSLIESIHTLGTYVFELHKTSCSLKEDDLSFSTFSFKKDILPHDEVCEMLLKAQKQVQTKAKAEQQEKEPSNKLEAKELIAHIRFRRALHLFIKALGSTYELKNEKKIEAEMKTFKKRFCDLQTMIEQNKLKEELPIGVFDDNIWKTLRSNLSSRTCNQLTLKETFDQFDNMVYQLELFIPPPVKISEFRNRLDMLSYQPINLLAKSYYKANFFVKENYLMNTIKIEEAFANDIKEWINVTPQLKNHEKFANLIIFTAPTLAQAIYKQLGRNTRWFWEISKIYDDFNALIHLCSEIDGYLQERKKDAFLSSWFYNYATTSMIRQLLWGFEGDLYEPCEYHYVAYYLENILHINQRNNNLFLNRIDKSIIDNYHERGLTKKMKKQLSDGEKRSLSDSIFLKGLHFYFRAFFRLLVLLIARGHIVDPFADSLQLRINNRFRIFKNIVFLKRLNYETYKKEVELILSDQGKIIDEASELLKGAKNIFSLFNQFENYQTYFKQCEEAIILEKLCVKLSLVAMSLKFKQKKKFSLAKEYPKYPEIVMQ